MMPYYPMKNLARWIELAGFKKMAIKRTCYICGEKYFLHRHHIVARSKGGEEDLFKLKEMREVAQIKPPRTNGQIAELPLEIVYSGLTFQELHAIQTQRQHSPVDRLMK